MLVKINLQSSKSKLALPSICRNYYAISPLGVELGIWQGHYKYATLPWLHWWGKQGNLLLTCEERAEQERLRAEQAEFLVARERLRAEQLAERLRSMGLDPDH